MTAELWAGLATTRDPGQDLPRAKLPVLGAAVMAACDGLDGLEDGLIDDPRDCDFDPGVLQCEAEDAADCLTAGQVAAARAIYAGPVRPSTGESLFPGYALGSEHFEAPDGLGGWARYWSGITEPGGSTGQFMRYSVFEDPDYDLGRFDFDADWDRANNRSLGNDETLATALNAVDPDLSAFKARGGKLISYHGWADALITGHYAVQYYESVLDEMGGLEKTTDFYRLFMAPGVAHCRGGPGPDRFDAVGALERWVEQGEAPSRIIASKVEEGEVRRTRPLCAYPQLARYDGSGQHRRRGELRLRQSRLRISRPVPPRGCPSLIAAAADGVRLLSASVCRPARPVRRSRKMTTFSRIVSVVAALGVVNRVGGSGGGQRGRGGRTTRTCCPSCRRTARPATGRRGTTSAAWWPRCRS